MLQMIDKPIVCWEVKKNSWGPVYGPMCMKVKVWHHTYFKNKLADLKKIIYFFTFTCCFLSKHVLKLCVSILKIKSFGIICTLIWNMYVDNNWALNLPIIISHYKNITLEDILLLKRKAQIKIFFPVTLMHFGRSHNVDIWERQTLDQTKEKDKCKV